MTPNEFEYLIRKTVTYLDFHSDDTAKELMAQWQQVLSQIHQMKRAAAEGKTGKKQGRSPRA